VYDADLRLSKSFNLTHGVKLQVLGEVFNVLNHNIPVVTAANQDSFRVTYNSKTGTYSITKYTNTVTRRGALNNVRPRPGLLPVKSTPAVPYRGEGQLLAVISPHSRKAASGGLFCAPSMGIGYPVEVRREEVAST